MSESQDDPFTQGAKALFDAFLAYPPFIDQTRVGNRISAVRRTGAVNAPIQNKIGPADFLSPLSLSEGGEFRVMMGEPFTLSPLGGNSISADAVQTYRVELNTDSLDATRVNKLKWAGFRALSRAMRGQFPLGLSFCRNCTITEATETTSRTDPTGGATVLGWSCAFNVNLEMYWQRSTL
jgi:hypothetical protein